jgi:replication factor C subunit 3/5
MALLVDKHRPRNLEALNYHPELSDRLRALVRCLRIQHDIPA